MNKKIIVAIDLSNLNKAIRLVKKLKKEAFAFKLGHEFFYNFGIDGYKKIFKIYLILRIRRLHQLQFV